MNLFVSLYTRRELLWQFLVRNVKARHRGSILGAFWLIANPLLMLGLYVFAFGVVFGGRFTESLDESTLDYALGVFLGLTILGLVSGVISSSPEIIVSQPNFVKKVVFPLEILPASTVGAQGYDVLISFFLCLIGVVFFRTGSVHIFFVCSHNYLSCFYDCSRTCLVFSALGVFIRDVRQIGSFLGLALLYSSGVFYSAAKVESTAPAIWTFLQWNPLLQIIDSLRQVILWGGEPNWTGIGYAWIFGLFVLFFGAWFFNRLRPAFADVL